MRHETITYTVPTWALSYLINADMSGYNDEEEQAVGDFEQACIETAKEQGACSWHFATDDEAQAYFAPRNDVTGWEGGDVEQINLVLMFEE